MANHKSAKKAIRQNIKRNMLNKSRKSRIKTYIKKVMLAQESNEASLVFKVAQSEIMKGVNKRILHLNTASRIISKLASKVKLLKGVVVN